MNEIEKMYKNCKIKKQYCGWLDMGDLDTQYTYVRCDSLEEFNDTAMMSRTSYSSEEEDWDKPSIEYPPFTAEKQILLIQWLLDKTDLYLHRHKTDFTYSIASGAIAVNKYKDFKESIAEFINASWQDLTEAEKAEIKNILEM